MSEYGTARRLLNGAAAALATAGRPVDTIYVQAGAGTLDREMLCARLMRGYRGVPGTPIQTANNCNDPASLHIDLCLVRACWPVSGNSGKPPTATAIDDATQLLALDADTLMTYALTYTSMPDGGPPYPAVGPLEWLTPAGGIAGFMLTVQVAEAF